MMWKIILLLMVIISCNMIAFGMARDMPLVNFTGAVWFAMTAFFIGLDSGR